MRIELQKKLVEKYPKIFSAYGGDPKVTCMAWGIECGDGWYNIIDSLCSCITGYLGSANIKYNEKNELVDRSQEDPAYVHHVTAEQVKEKYGTLRFYYNGGNETTEAMVSLAERLSGVTCEICGCKSEPPDDKSGWVHTLCEDCLIDSQRKDPNG